MDRNSFPANQKTRARLSMPQNATFCSRCGAPLGEDATFCSKCGAPASGTFQQVPRGPKHTARGLAAGLILVLIGIFFYLSQTVVMPTQFWWAYFIAGLGLVLVAVGLVPYIKSGALTRESRAAEVKGHPEPASKGNFSGQLGIEHSRLTGRKILFEFDPSMPYQRVVRDFALECVFNKEKVIVLTPAGSVIQQALEDEEGVKIINLTPDTMLSSILEQHPERPLNLVYDSLTDLALSAEARTAYRFAMNSLRQLSDAKITAIFLLNPSAHEAKDVSSLRGLFSNQVVYGKEGMTSVKFA